MKKRSQIGFLAIFFQFALNLIASVLAQSNKTPKQIIFIKLDDAGPGDLGFRLDNSSPSIYKLRTPNIDELKIHSALYPRVIGATVCGPSRASFLTGIPPQYSQVRGNADSKKNLILPAITFPLALQQSGWNTTIAGKFGFGSCNSGWGIKKFGFDQALVFDTHVQAHYPFPRFLSDNCRTKKYPKNNQTNRNKCLDNKCTSAEDEALKFIIARINFCADNNIPCAHFYMPISPHLGSFSRGKSTYPVSSYADYPRSWQIDLRSFAAMMTLADNRIGEVIATLKEKGIYEQTLLILFSDNGAERKYINGRATSNDPFRSTGGRKGNKRSMYEGGLNTPLIISWPKVITANSSSVYSFATHDLPLTILDLIGTSPAIKSKFAPPGMIEDGAPISVASLLTAKKFVSGRKYIFSENCENGEQSCTFAVYKVDDWQNVLFKLVANTPGAKPELYELNNDPTESKDLALDPKNKAIIDDLLAARAKNRIPI